MIISKIFRRFRPGSILSVRNAGFVRTKLSNELKRLDPKVAPVPEIIPEPFLEQQRIFKGTPHEKNYEMLKYVANRSALGNVEKLSKLLPGCDVNCRSIHTGQTPLMVSQSTGITRLLLQNGADPNLQNRQGNSALHFSIARGDFEMSELLIKWGANLNVRNMSRRGILPTEINVKTDLNIQKLESTQVLPLTKRLIWSSKYPREADLSQVLAVDIEFIGLVDSSVGHLGTVDIPYEIAIVDAHLNTVFFSRCRPSHLPPLGEMDPRLWRRKHCKHVDDSFTTGRSYQLRTQITGLQPGDLDNEPPIDLVLAEVRQILQGKYLVGNGLSCDILALEYFVPPYQAIRDTAKYMAWRDPSYGHDEVGLKRGVLQYLKRDIQGKIHTALEDTKATMELYLMFKDEWESSDDSFLNEKPVKEKMTMAQKLEPIGVLLSEPGQKSIPALESHRYPVNELKLFLDDLGLPLAQYKESKDKVTCNFHKFKTESSAGGQIGKHEAAREMLNILQKIESFETFSAEITNERLAAAKIRYREEPTEQTALKDLKNLTDKLLIPNPLYTSVESAGEEAEVECSLGSYTSKGIGSSNSTAKRRAAINMLQLVSDFKKPGGNPDTDVP